MKNISRLFLDKCSKEERSDLISKVVRLICEHTKPEKIIFFGSITTDQFDAMSDIDVVVVFADLEEASRARKTLYSVDRAPIRQPIDFVCVDHSTYESKSQIGGVLYIARESGIEVLS